jgi:hypothetical protein
MASGGYFTKTPNDLIDDVLPDMEKGELKLTLVLLRFTEGYNRRCSCSFSKSDLMKKTGLSRPAVYDAIKAVLKRGYFAVSEENGNVVFNRLDVNSSYTEPEEVLDDITPDCKMSLHPVLNDLTLTGALKKTESKESNCVNVPSCTPDPDPVFADSENLEVSEPTEPSLPRKRYNKAIADVCGYVRPSELPAEEKRRIYGAAEAHHARKTPIALLKAFLVEWEEGDEEAGLRPKKTRPFPSQVHPDSRDFQNFLVRHAEREAARVERETWEADWNRRKWENHRRAYADDPPDPEGVRAAQEFNERRRAAEAAKVEKDRLALIEMQRAALMSGGVPREEVDRLSYPLPDSEIIRIRAPYLLKNVEAIDAMLASYA